MATGFKLKGAKHLDRVLKNLGGKGAKRALRAATRSATAVLLKNIKKEVPVDEGKLKKAQASKVVARGLNMTGIVGADVGKLKADNEEDGSRPTNIDHLSEFGHQMADGSRVPASGHMRRGAANGMPAAERRYEDVLTRQIEAEASRG